MDEITQSQLNNMGSKDKQQQNAAYAYLMEITERPVEWATAVWDDLVMSLSDKDNHVRAISAQLLSNLAKSVTEEVLANDFETLLKVTKDERFVTARHCLQSLWKVGLAGASQKKLVVLGLERRFDECVTEKNSTLIRYDIIQGLRHLYEATQDETLRQTAVALMATEEDLKYRKKYAKLWPKQEKPA